MDKKHFETCLDNLTNNFDYPLTEPCLPELITSLCNEKFDKISSYKPMNLATLFQTILGDHGEDLLEPLRKIVLLECILNSWDGIFSEKYPKSIQDQFEKNFNRFLQTCNDTQGWTKYQEDVYWKDLAIARQQIFPAGAQIVETYSGFGWRQGLSINLMQSIKFILFILKAGGKKGYYQIHTHIPELSEFNEQGWNKCYIRMAQMLKINQKIKGMVGGSWFYDPQLEWISPRLMYLQKIPLSNGAKAFHVGEDKTGNPFAKSETRRKLHKEGKYIPQSYLLIWPRKELIKWADKQRTDL